MLYIAGAAETRREQLLLVRDRISIAVAELPDFVGVGLHCENCVLPYRHHEPREGQLVYEHGVLLVDAIVVDVLMDRDAADWRELVGRVGVLHVTADLEDEHTAVAVKCDLHRLLDCRLGEDWLDAVARRKQKPLLLLCGRHSCDRLLRRQIRPLERVRSASAPPPSSS